MAAGPHLEQEIARRATEFEPVALLALLAHAGYRPEEVILQSQHGHASATALVQSVEFTTTPMRHVVVTLNMGLLGAQSPLPSYFAQLLASDEVDEAAFLDFIHFFDHLLLDGHVRAAAPERDPSVYRSFDETKRSYLGLIGLASTSTLHWLFQLAFPELGLRVDRSTLTRVVPLEGVRLNASQLGGAGVLGGKARLPVPGFAVTLFCDEEHSDFGEPWVEQVRRRLDAEVFPVIAPAALDVRVSVVIRSEKVWARLSPTSYLGFDRLRGGKRRDREVVVWSGQVSASSRCIRHDRARAPRAERAAR